MTGSKNGRRERSWEVDMSVRLQPSSPGHGETLWQIERGNPVWYGTERLVRRDGAVWYEADEIPEVVPDGEPGTLVQGPYADAEAALLAHPRIVEPLDRGDRVVHNELSWVDATPLARPDDRIHPPNEEAILSLIYQVQADNDDLEQVFELVAVEDTGDVGYPGGDRTWWVWRCPVEVEYPGGICHAYFSHDEVIGFEPLGFFADDAALQGWRKDMWPLVRPEPMIAEIAGDRWATVVEIVSNFDAGETGYVTTIDSVPLHRPGNLEKWCRWVVDDPEGSGLDEYEETGDLP